jgi:TonB family protein
MYLPQRTRFRVIRSVSKGKHFEEKLQYIRRLEKGLLVSLLFFIVLFSVSRRIPRERIPDYPTLVASDFFWEFTPQTSRGGVLQKPTLPKIPIPSEDEYIPKDLTIESTDLDLYEGIYLFDGLGDDGANRGGMGGMGPRPIREVIPEYPEEEQKRNREGVVELSILVNPDGRVDSVQVNYNTTGSRLLEKAAVEAAYKSRYKPARNRGRAVSLWIRRPYRFERK